MEIKRFSIVILQKILQLEEIKIVIFHLQKIKVFPEYKQVLVMIKIINIGLLVMVLKSKVVLTEHGFLVHIVLK